MIVTRYWYLLYGYEATESGKLADQPWTVELYKSTTVVVAHPQKAVNLAPVRLDSDSRWNDACKSKTQRGRQRCGGATFAFFCVFVFVVLVVVLVVVAACWSSCSCSCCSCCCCPGSTACCACNKSCPFSRPTQRRAEETLLSTTMSGGQTTYCTTVCHKRSNVL